MKFPLSRLLATLFLAGPACSATPAGPPPKTQRVVLVHGFLENGSAFKMLRKRLEKRGVECFVPRLRHNDGRGGLEKLALHLSKTSTGSSAPTSRSASSPSAWAGW
jgi:hypothetical protein